MNVGLFGGTFDPIHLGHVDMICQLCEHMVLDKIIFIPAYIPPHKHKLNMTPYCHRLAMTRLAIENYSSFEVSSFESESVMPSYTFHTIEHYKEIYPHDNLFYVMGVDSFNTIEEWYRWQELLCLANFVIVDRPNKTLDIATSTSQVLANSPYDIFYLPLHTLPISSTMIREKIAAHQSVDVFLQPNVLQYINEHYLYQ